MDHRPAGASEQENDGKRARKRARDEAMEEARDNRVEVQCFRDRNDFDGRTDRRWIRRKEVGDS